MELKNVTQIVLAVAAAFSAWWIWRKTRLEVQLLKKQLEEHKLDESTKSSAEPEQDASGHSGPPGGTSQRDQTSVSVVVVQIFLILCFVAIPLVPLWDSATKQPARMSIPGDWNGTIRWAPTQMGGASPLPTDDCVVTEGHEVVVKRRLAGLLGSELRRDEGLIVHDGPLCGVDGRLEVALNSQQDGGKCHFLLLWRWSGAKTPGCLWSTFAQLGEAFGR